MTSAPLGSGGAAGEQDVSVMPIPDFMLGSTRSMISMMQFNEQKDDYINSLANLEADSDEYRRVIAECHDRGAKRAVMVAKMQRGLYVKAAQFVVSIRGGTGDRGVPRAYTEALSVFTDHAPHCPISQVAHVLKEAMYLGEWPAAELDDACAFRSIDNEPIAAASLAQVHRAVLQDGTLAAVKVQYPELRKEMASDFAVFKTMGATMKPEGYDLMWVIEDFEKNLTRELDFELEATNGEMCAAQLRHLAPRVFVPKVIRELSSDRVLTMEFCTEMIKANDAPGLRAQGLDVEECASLLCSTFAEMIFVHGMVHADPHAGNIYFRVREENGVKKPQLVILDHGLYFDLAENDVRINFCRYWKACSGKDGPVMDEIGKRFAGALRRFLPLLLSPWFVFGGTGVSLREIVCASKGELPDTIGLKDVADFVVATREGGANLIGLLHSLGYTRGLLEALNFPEGKRVALFLKYAMIGDNVHPPAIPSELTSAERAWVSWRMTLLSGHIRIMAPLARPLMFFAKADKAPPLWLLTSGIALLTALGVGTACWLQQAGTSRQPLAFLRSVLGDRLTTE